MKQNLYEVPTLTKYGSMKSIVQGSLGSYEEQVDEIILNDRSSILFNRTETDNSEADSELDSELVLLLD